MHFIKTEINFSYLLRIAQSVISKSKQHKVKKIKLYFVNLSQYVLRKKNGCGLRSFPQFDYLLIMIAYDVNC